MDVKVNEREVVQTQVAQRSKSELSDPFLLKRVSAMVVASLQSHHC